MEEDIEKLIESFVVPEMEYVKTKRGADDKTVDVPEVVLPKTRAEVYEEAKGRLGQKTSAVSRRGAAKSERTKTRGRADGGTPLKTKTPRKSRERADVPEVVLPDVAATVTPNAAHARARKRAAPCVGRAQMGGRLERACAVCLAQPARGRRQAQSLV